MVVATHACCLDILLGPFTNAFLTANGATSADGARVSVVETTINEGHETTFNMVSSNAQCCKGAELSI